MGELDELEDMLGHLEHDEIFQQAVALVCEGVVSRRQADASCRAYRMYTTEIERFTESPPMMRRVLGDPLLKIWFFRVFGYRGELQFGMGQAIWFRDLPLLDIGRDAHLGYGMMLGTSQILPDGESVLLRAIRIGARTFFNQHTVVEGGARIGADVSVGTRATIGADARIGAHAEIADQAVIGEETILGEGCRIGKGAVVGRAAIVDAGVEVAPGDEVPAHHRLTAGGLFPRPHRWAAA